MMGTAGPWGRMHRDEGGAVIVEFAAIFVVFAMLLWGLITYGVIFAAQQSVTHGAADAARATVGQYPDEDEARSRAEDIIDAQLGEGSWLDPAGLSHSVEFGPCEGTAERACATVHVTYDWANHAIVPEMLSVATPNALSSKAVVQWD